MDTIDSLCKRYSVDLAHAQFVASLALGLFDALLPIHHLSARDRELVEMAALLHDVGIAVDVENHHTAGCGIVLAASLAGADPVERAMMACMVAFHRQAVQPETEGVYTALTAQQQRRTLALSALLRIADGLDYSQTQSTRIVSVDVDPGAAGDDAEGEAAVEALPAGAAARVRVHGPNSHQDAARATKKADLWNSLFMPLTASGRMTRPGLDPDIGPAEAARRILHYQVDKLTPEEWILASDGGLSAARIHRIRVTVRRLHATLRAFRPYFRRRSIRPIRQGLGALSRRLAVVREYDVLVSLARSFAGRCDNDSRPGVDFLLDTWRAGRRQARARLARYLHSRAHHRWLDQVMQFTQTDAGDRRSKRCQASVADVGPAIVEQRLAKVAACDTLPDSPAAEDIHRLRIAVKRLRYLADALREVLPVERADALLAHCVEAQDAYGALHDARFAALRALECLEQDGLPSHLMRGILAFADAQHRLAEGRLKDWRQYLAPLLMI